MVGFRQQETKEDSEMIRTRWMVGSIRTTVLYYEEEGLIIPTGYERIPVSYAAKIEQYATGVVAVISIWLACPSDKPTLGTIIPAEDLGGWLLQMGTEKVDQWEYPADQRPPGLQSWVPGQPWTAISFSIAAEGLGSLDWLQKTLRRALNVIHERLTTVAL